MIQKQCLAAMLAGLAGAAVPAQQAPAQVAAPAASEAAIWQSIEGSTDPTDYMNYLKQYSDGPHAADAMKRIESYALGLNYGLNLRRQPMDVDIPSLVHGVEDQVTGAKTQTTSQEVDAALADLQAREKNSQSRDRVPAGEESSYALGVNYGRVLAKNMIEVDAPSLVRGLKDTLNGEKPLLTSDEAQAALTESSIRSSVKVDEMHHQVAEENGKAGADFLAANKSKPGVVALKSGLQYKIMKTGTGPKPTVSDAVTCDFRGTLITGEEFDNTYKEGDPQTFMVREVIPGWKDALLLMPVGSKWQLFIPGDLAYGDTGRGKQIGPNATIVLEVELHSIVQNK